MSAEHSPTAPAAVPAEAPDAPWVVGPGDRRPEGAPPVPDAEAPDAPWLSPGP
jgi:hypothetical protein